MFTRKSLETKPKKIFSSKQYLVPGYGIFGSGKTPMGVEDKDP
jgi:hypothetical protein